MSKTVGQVPQDIQGKLATKSNHRLSILVGILIVCALLVRMYNADAPYSIYYGTRFGDSAIFAQAVYLLGESSTPDLIRRVARTNLEQAYVLEPRIGERLAVLGYRIFGINNWWPRLFLSTFWCLSALAIYALVLRIHSPSAAILSVLYYLFCPFAIFTNRLFQPDSLMVSFMATSLFCLWNEFHRPSRTSFCLAVVTTSLAMLIKIPCACLLIPALAALALERYGLKGSLRNPRVWLLILGISLPSLGYYGMGLFVSGALRYQVGVQWQPARYLQAIFWYNWLYNAVYTLGIPALILGGVGVYFFRNLPARYMILGLWIGYLAYGLVFPIAISTHGYYNMPLIIILAITMGPPLLAMARHWMRLAKAFRLAIGIMAVAVLLGVVGVVISPRGTGLKRVLSPQFREQLEEGMNLCGAHTWEIRNWGSRQDELIRTAVQIGRTLQHSNRVVMMRGVLCPAMNYYGLISGYVWPDVYRLRSLKEGISLPIEEEFPKRLQSLKPEYFVAWPEDHLRNSIVDTSLVLYLDQRYPVLERKDGYVIYDLRSVHDANSIP